MSAEQIQSKILGYLQSGEATPLDPQTLARKLATNEQEVSSFREALREMMHNGRVVLGARGAVVLPMSVQRSGLITGTYKQHKRGFGFVMPTDPRGHEDLFIPPGQAGGAISGDVVSAKITSRGQRDGKSLYEGKVIEVLQRTNTRFVGSLQKQAGEFIVFPDGNTFTEPIFTPDAGSRHVKLGTMVVVELTQYPAEGKRAQGVIVETLGNHGEKDVDLRSVIVQYGLPREFPDEVMEQARQAIARFNAGEDLSARLDLSGEIICTIDPDDAKDYDDAISLRQLDDGTVELGVHIADVSYFVPKGTPLDEEAYKRGNSCYFPGFVIPMLPEILSNGVCSLQADVPRLCKSAFISFDASAKPVRTRFANTIIKSAQRFRYREAQAIIDNASEIPHPEGPRRVSDYPAAVVKLLGEMNALARRIQKRRLAEGQIVLELPEVELVLDESGKVVGTREEDTSFTHTLIEMFMVEANEAIARLLDSIGVPFMRRIHPGPESDSAERLRHFVQVAGYKLPKDMDRKALQSLLASVRGKPESFAINLAVLKSLSRAEYSPQEVGHFALASEYYCHFTSPIRRYADLMVHRLLDEYVRQRDAGGGVRKKRKFIMDEAPTYDQLVEAGKHISYTERRADDAERDLRQVKLLEVMKAHVGEEFAGVVTGITNFGIFVQLSGYLVDGLIRYEDLLDDWWDVDERAGRVRGQRTGKTIGIGDVAKVIVVKVDVARRELSLSVTSLHGKGGKLPAPDSDTAPGKGRKGGGKPPGKGKFVPVHRDSNARGGGNRRGGGPVGGNRGPNRGGRPQNKGPKRAGKRGRR